MNDKELVAHHAAQQVTDGMCVGLGTGSTANCFIDELARRYHEENLQVNVVASSVISARKAQQLGLPLVAIEHIAQLDLYVDGADEVDADLTLLKGRGADLVREKLLVEACKQFLVLVDSSKFVSHIGERFAIPIEVMPFAWQLVKRKLEASGAVGDLRKNASGNGFMMTSHGSLVLDMRFDNQSNSQILNELLNNTAGVVEHGIFYGLASTVLCAVNGQVQEHHARD